MDYSKEAQKILHQVSISAWNYFVSVSPITKQLLDEAEEVCVVFHTVKIRPGSPL
jgi:hypothetical protein